MNIESVRELLIQRLPGIGVELVPNGAPNALPSLSIAKESLREVAQLLRDEPTLLLDYCSNVTGMDWLERTEKVKVRQMVDGVAKEVEQARKVPGYLEVVYHLYSMRLRHGPLVIRARTEDRSAGATIPSLTPVWRSCELQEREVYDLFGVYFEGHPDLRRIMMWDGFKDHPMRKDYTEPDDYEYEPTPHDQVLERVTSRRAQDTEKAPSA